MLRFATLMTTLAFTVTANAEELLISVADNVGTMLPGVTFTDGDIVQTNAAGSSASLFTSGMIFGNDPDIDAFHVMADGRYLVSSLFNDLSFNGPTSFRDGDIAVYDPATDTAALFLSEDLFTGSSVDISAVSMDAAGNLLLSTLGDAALAGTSFTDGDIVKYDLNNGAASIVVNEVDLFDDGNGDVYGLHALDNGNFLITTNVDEVISGTLFRDGDIFEYDPITDTATLVFSEDSFTDGVNSHDIDAIYLVPEPASALLLVVAGLARRRR